MLREPDVAPGFLAAQRRAIQERLGSGASHSPAFGLAPAMASLCLILLGLILSRPGPTPQPTLASASSEGEFYTEIYAMVESPEPWVAEPMYGLFEDD